MSYQIDIVHDGTRTGFISAALAFLASAPSDVTSLSFTFEGEVIVLTAEAARAAAWPAPIQVMPSSETRA